MDEKSSWTIFNTSKNYKVGRRVSCTPEQHFLLFGKIRSIIMAPGSTHGLFPKNHKSLSLTVRPISMVMAEQTDRRTKCMNTFFRIRLKRKDMLEKVVPVGWKMEILGKLLLEIGSHIRQHEEFSLC